ncbi:YegP family protein [Chloroflexota bacterium]
MTAKFEIYKGKIGDFRWRLTHTNGQIIATSGEGYTTKVNAIHGLNSVKKNAPNSTIEDRTVA